MNDTAKRQPEEPDEQTLGQALADRVRLAAAKLPPNTLMAVLYRVEAAAGGDD